jgi:hypothetical protein
MFGYSTGLSAFAFKHGTSSDTMLDVVNLMPCAARRVTSILLAGRGAAPTGSLRSAWALEARGLAEGPVRYALGRRALRART